MTSRGHLAAALLAALDSMSTIYEPERDDVERLIEANLRAAIEALLPKLGRPLPMPEYLVGGFPTSPGRGGHKPD